MTGTPSRSQPIMETPHTRAPWLVSERAQFRIIAEWGDTIATVGCDSALRDQWEANAAFIVDAVNSHAALVKALEFYADPSNYDRSDTYDSNGFTRPVMRDTGKFARAALSHRSAKT